MLIRSKQTEAKTMLKALFVGQDLYKITNQIYSVSYGSNKLIQKGQAKLVLNIEDVIEEVLPALFPGFLI